MKLRQIREAQKRKNKNNISQMRERLCRLTYLYADGPHLAVFSGRPNKPAPFKTLGKQAGSLAVPPDNFEQITTPPPPE